MGKQQNILHHLLAQMRKFERFVCLARIIHKFSKMDIILQKVSLENDFLLKILFKYGRLAIGI
jgi:hypothetical protein